MNREPPILSFRHPHGPPPAAAPQRHSGDTPPTAHDGRAKSPRPGIPAGPPPRVRKPQTWVMLTAAACLLALAFHYRLQQLPQRSFDPDEFQHLHMAWCMAQGQVPYRDFFEHHTPLLHYLLAPWMRWFQPETSADAAVAMVLAVRWAMLGFTVVILAATVWIGALWRDLRTGLAAAVILACTPMFVEKSLEIRPDLPSTALWLTALGLILTALRRPRPGPWFLAGGLAYGLALMCTQKLLLAGPGLAVALLWFLADPRQPGRWRQRLGASLWFALGALLPLAAALAGFAAAGAAGDFIRCNFIINAQWESSFPPTDYLRQLQEQNPLFRLLALAGFGLAALLTPFRRALIQRGTPFLLLGAGALAGGLYLIPVPHRQYYLTFLPLGALFAALALTAPFAFLENRLGGGGWRNLLRLAMGLLCAGLLALACRQPLRVIQQEAADTGGLDQLEAMRFVMDHSTSRDACLDGFSGYAAFRPHAWRYWFLHGEMRAMLDRRDLYQFEDALRSGKITPGLLLFDDNLRDLSPGVTRFLNERYEPAGPGNVWRRKPATPPATAPSPIP